MYGRNCSTGGIYVSIPPISGGGCGTPQITQMDSKLVGSNIESKYKMTIEKNPPGGSAALLLTFSQPVTLSSVVISGSVRIIFQLKIVTCLINFHRQGAITVTQSTSDTSLILDTTLSITSATTFIDMTITTDAGNPDLEPCLIYNSCNYCENDNCRPQVENFLKNGTRLQTINRFSAHLEYECGLAKKFVISDTMTAQDISMTCEWYPQWTPTATIPECACKSIGPQDLQRHSIVT